MLTTLPRPAAGLFGCGALRVRLLGLLCCMHARHPAMQAQPGLAVALRAEPDALHACTTRRADARLDRSCGLACCWQGAHGEGARRR